MRYIALLRGVNVGGKNMLPMPALRAELTARGFLRVETYINSGNILFDSDGAQADALKARLEAVLLDVFAIRTPVAVLSAADLIEAMRRAPPWWNAAPDAKHNAIFVIAPMTAEAAAQAAGTIKPEYERMACHGQVIFWSAPVATFSRTRWSRVVGTTLYDSVTIRNANTALKLLALAQSPPPR